MPLKGDRGRPLAPPGERNPSLPLFLSAIHAQNIQNSLAPTINTCKETKVSLTLFSLNNVAFVVLCNNSILLHMCNATQERGVRKSYQGSGCIVTIELPSSPF